MIDCFDHYIVYHVYWIVRFFSTIYMAHLLISTHQTKKKKILLLSLSTLYSLLFCFVLICFSSKYPLKLLVFHLVPLQLRTKNWGCFMDDGTYSITIFIPSRVAKRLKESKIRDLASLLMWYYFVGFPTMTLSSTKVQQQ